MAHAEGVPVTMSGIEIGNARVDDDGSIELTIKIPNRFGQELFHHILMGTVLGLSISPTIEPARRANKKK